MRRRVRLEARRACVEATRISAASARATPAARSITLAEGEQGALRGELASPDQGAAKIPLTSVTATDRRTRFTGIWTVAAQPDVEVAFVRSRATAEREARVRPQTPKPPFPYRTEDVTFKNPVADAVTLAGTLRLPKGAGPFPPQCSSPARVRRIAIRRCSATKRSRYSPITYR